MTFLLPDKPYFTLIERHLPSPGQTCQQISASIEKTEQEAIDKEIAKRRMRLGANLEQVTRDVKRDVLCKSEVSRDRIVMRLISARGCVPEGHRLE